MIGWIFQNWALLFFIFYFLEKFVKLTPFKADDILIDIIGKQMLKAVEGVYLEMKELFGKKEKIKKDIKEKITENIEEKKEILDNFKSKIEKVKEIIKEEPKTKRKPRKTRKK